MRGSKGFTLVELLAVLVILAIIALVSTPVILGVIDNARKDGAKDKAWGVIDSVKLAFTQDQMGNNPQFGNDGNRSITFSTAGGEKVGSEDVRFSGQRPESGTATISEDGIVTVKNLKFDQYYCTTDDSATLMCCAKETVATCTKDLADK